MGSKPEYVQRFLRPPDLDHTERVRGESFRSVASSIEPHSHSRTGGQ